MAMTLTKTRLAAGVWEGLLTGAGKEPPALQVMQGDGELPGLTIDPDPETGDWLVRVPVPPAVIADGVQTFVIASRDSGDTLASFVVVAGEALADDIRAEMELLRAELDMLKRAFRRHCLETT